MATEIQMLTIPMPGHVGIHWKAVTEHSQMNTHVPGLIMTSFDPYTITGPGP